MKYRTEEYRKWNRERMRRYRQGPYGLHEYIRNREHDLQRQRARVERELRCLERQTI